jgi:hypothetical protein
VVHGVLARQRSLVVRLKRATVSCASHSDTQRREHLRPDVARAVRLALDQPQPTSISR